MKVIWRIASNTFRQTVRQRLFYNVVLFGIGLIILAMVVSQITFGFPDRVVRSIGLSGVSIALNLMGLLVGVSLIHQEIDRRTLFVVLTRPVTRWQYVAGRYLGLLLALLMIGVGRSFVFAIVLTTASGSLTTNDLFALSATLPEAAVIGGVGLVLSAFTTPTLGTGLGLGFWIVCASTDDLVRLTENQGFTNQLARATSYLLPSLARFDFREAAVHKLEVATLDWSAAWIYGLVYCVLLVALASAVLYRREMV